MASYLNPHPKTGWRYQRGIPKDLRSLFGGKKVSVKYIPAMPRREAEKHARAYAVKDDELWSKLRQLSAEEAAKVVGSGGMEALQQSLPDQEFWLRVAKHGRWSASNIDPYKTIRDYEKILGVNTGLPDDCITPEKTALWKHESMERWTKKEAELKEEIHNNSAILNKISPKSSEYSLDCLFKLWVKVQEPKTTRKQLAVIQLFKEVVGDVDYRTVTQAEAAKFRDHLAAMRKS